LEAAARAIIARIDNLGGPLAAIEKGFVQGEIQNSAYQYQRAIEEGRQIVVGVNKFQSAATDSAPTFRLNPELERQQIERLRVVRAGRSNADVQDSLRQLEATARDSENLLPKIFSACRALATVGEISDTLRGVFGEYRETF